MGSDADKPLTAADLDALERSRTTNCGTCGGGGWRHPHCSRCDDSTDDHECPPPYLCPDCLGNGKTGCVEVRRETLPRLLAAAREAERLRSMPFDDAECYTYGDLRKILDKIDAERTANRDERAVWSRLYAVLTGEPEGSQQGYALADLEARVRKVVATWKTHLEIQRNLRDDRDAWKARAERAEARIASMSRKFPILGDRTGATIPWCVAEVAYEDYKRRFGDGQTLERIAERGGFCPLELIEHLGLKAAAERAAKEGGK